MDQRFLHYYERELRYVRELGAEFARRFPKIGARLGLSDLSCEDPHVERLLQGFALLAGRVHVALDAEYPDFTQPLAELLSRSYLAPTPSMTIAQFAVDARGNSLGESFAIPRDTVLRARSGVQNGTACEFRTAHPVQLMPISIEGAEYTSVLRDIADLRVPTREPIRALFKLRLRAHNLPFERLRLQTLPLFLQGGDETSARLYEQLITSANTIVLRWGPRAARTSAFASEQRPVRPLGFAPEQHLLPRTAPAFEGHRLLEEYFAFPARFDFVELTGLASGAARCPSNELELIVPLTRFDPALEGAIDATRVLLFATPAVNLFAFDCGRLPVPKNTHELHITPDPTRPLDFELHSLNRVTGHTADGAYDLKPCHVLHAGLEHTDRLRYLSERRAIAVPQRRGGPGSTYLGSEVFLRLIERSGAHAAPTRSQLQHLSVQALCTNRDLPLDLSLGRGGNDFEVRSGIPAAAVRCVAGPSAPRPAPVQGESTWRWLSHLSRNYLALSRETGGAEALREMLELYAQHSDPLLRRQIEGVRSIRSAAAVGPMPGPGPRTFARGLSIELECDEQAFVGLGALKLAGVLSVLFARHAPSSSFTETRLTTRERGEVYRWPTVAGLRHVL